MSTCKLSSKDVQEIKRRRKTGETYASMAKDFGVSISLIKRYCDEDRPPKRKFDNDKIIYKGLREWIADNEMTVKKMSEESGIYYTTLYYFMIGKNEPAKKTIDKILKYTGMTYEEAFEVG